MPLFPPSSRGGASSRGDNAVTNIGLVSQAGDVRDYTNAVAPGGGLLTASLVGLNAGDKITNILLVNTVIASGAAPTLIRVNVFDKNYNLLAQSNDLSASGIWLTQGYMVAPLSAPLTITADGAYYFGFLKVGTFATTQPTFVSGTTQTIAGRIVTGTARYWFEQSGLADSPNPAVPANPTNAPVWFGAS